MAALITGTMLIDLCNSYAAVAVVGHAFASRPEILAAVSVGTMLFNICLLSTSYGIASGLDTLLSQAHGAVLNAQQGSAVGTDHPGRAHVRWTVLILLLAWLPLGLFCMFSAPVLRSIGQPTDIAANAGLWARVLTLSSGAALVCRTVQGKIQHITDMA